MGKLYSLISALLLAVGVAQAASPDSYEWWWDDDVSSMQTGPVSGSAFDLQIDTSDLPKGIHYFNLRLAEGDSIYGAVYRKLFHAIGPDDNAISYEYWYDYDYASKMTGAMAVGSNHLELDVANLPQGTHYFNIRLGYGDGNWGSVYRKMVLNLAGSVDAAAFEYWIDNDYSAKTSGTLSPGANTYEIDLQGVRKGLHRFSYRLQTGTGIWGAPYTKYFYCITNEARFTEYEYWLDNDYAGRVTGTATSNPVSFEVDLSGFDKSGGAHYFNLRTRDGDGDWSPTYHKLLVFTDAEKRQPIIGYRHFLNVDSLGYVQVERQFVDNYMFEVNLPDSVYPSIANRRPTFDGDRVFIAETDTVDYTMQIQTELGWASPQKWKIGIANDFETTAMEMKVNTQQNFAAPADLQFAAVKFTAPGTPLYFRSDAAIALDIYKDGERVGRFTAAEVKGLAMAALEAGEYFGVLHSIENKEAENFTLHLMDTPNQVPIPKIEYADTTVTITCSRDDAEIRYTLDGKNPTEESTLYENAFTLKHNAVVKAKAWLPESDILPSEVAQYAVDSYTVATPTGKFDPQTRLLTIECATEDAAILYSFSSDGEWTLYEDPVAITKNCKVYAKATLKDYNDSEVATISVTELPDNVPAPVIEFVEGLVTIECANKEAEIHYTIDDPELTAESPIFKEPFPVDHNATIRAFALIPGLDIEHSDVTTKVIDSFKVATPTGEFIAQTRTLTLKCATEDAKIFYTFSLEGEWTPYSDPIVITKNCIVYAKATRDGYNDSEIATISITELADNVPAPVIEFADGMVTIECANKEAEIHYTIDDPKLTAESPLYKDPFPVDHNATIRAFALIPGLDIEPSDTTTKVIDSFKVATPSGEFNAQTRLLTITCATEDAKIFYSFSSEGEWTPYGDPIAITKNCIVYAKATRDSYNDSEVATISITELADNVPAPVIEFADGMVTIECANKEAEIHYTIDNPELTAESPVYKDPFHVDHNATIRAFALIPGLDIEPSDTTTKVIDSYKVATPTGEFNAQTRLLTITCATDDAEIFYSFSSEGEWTPYSDPIAITKNCIVYAKATRDGYNDSEVATISVTELADNVPAPVIEFADGMVTIECANKEAEIHYTIDDPNVTAESPLYSEPFALDHNATIRAYALIPGLAIEPSDVTTKVIDSFKVATPTGEFIAQTRTLTLKCATEDAKIFYTFSLEGEWTPYSDPIVITKNCIVYAKATRDGYNDSEIATISITELADNVPAPVIEFADGMVTIECANKEAEIHYTIDDPELTAESPVYKDPFPVDHNATIRAFALIPGLAIEPSEIVTKVIDSFKVDMPTGEFDAKTKLLTIECATEKASIFYSMSAEGEWTEYTDPIFIDGNRTVYAMATRDGWNDSDVAEIVVSDLKCVPVSIDYNGRYVSLDCDDSKVTIRYSTDGSNPANGTEYTGLFDVGGVCLLRAVAMKSGYMNSDVLEYPIQHYADKVHVETAAEGLLSSAFEWDITVPDSIRNYRIEGRLNDADYAFIRRMTGLRHLDISNVAEAVIPDAAFRDLHLVSIAMPTDLREYGDSIFTGNLNLSSVIWNSNTLDPEERLTNGLSNSNLLLYVPEEVNATGFDDLNVVKDGHAAAVALHHGQPYYAAQDFRADHVSITREFLQTTEVDVCRGWETIVLPFAPTEITHEVNGPAVPFAAWDGDTEGMKPFWLYSSLADGWEEASSIEACVPYIISMPNNPDYVPSSNLAGRVTFSADNVDLGPETSVALTTPWMNGTEFEGTFLPVEENGLLSMNVNVYSDDTPSGSVFVTNDVTVPFGAFVRGAGRQSMPVFGDSNGVDMPTLGDSGLVIETPAPGMLRISSGRERKVAVVTATGVTVRSLRLQPGETVTIEGLTRDLYIVGGVKVMVR